MLQTDLNSWHFLKVVIQVPPTRQGAAQYLLWYDSKQVSNLCDITACKLLITFWSSPGEDYSSCTKLFANHKSQMEKQPVDKYAWGCAKWDSSRHRDAKIKHKCEPTKEAFRDLTVTSARVTSVDGTVFTSTK